MSRIFIIIAITLCIGCATESPKKRRYALKFDKAPTNANIAKLKKTPNAIPKVEPKSKCGNPPSYVVFNKKYYPMTSNKGYKARGKASWYGVKFHGHKTSSGELFDMYSMSAAHKTLPLPTYLQVTNLHNGKKVIVKVNDRGPFHGNRILDLSYAAAAKLDMLKTGTTNVEIEAIDPKKFNRYKTPKTLAPPPTTLASTKNASYLQLGSFTNRKNAENLLDKLKRLSITQAKIQKSSSAKNTSYLVKVGPIKNHKEAQRIKSKLLRAGLSFLSK